MYARVSAAAASSKEMNASYGGEMVLVTCLDSPNPSLPVLAIAKSILVSSSKTRIGSRLTTYKRHNVHSGLHKQPLLLNIFLFSST